jgi:hypothetical protein
MERFVFIRKSYLTRLVSLPAVPIGNDQCTVNHSKKFLTTHPLPKTRQCNKQPKWMPILFIATLPVEQLWVQYSWLMVRSMDISRGVSLQLRRRPTQVSLSSLAIRYEIHMLGAPIEGLIWLFGDNKSMIDSASQPSGRLQKRHLILSWHRLREKAAMGIVH